VASSGAPPPGYTSQHDTLSFVDIDNDDDDETVSNHLLPPPPPPLMDSPYRDPLYHLPSPYSTEDLRLTAESHVQNQNPRRSLHRSPTQTCTHGFTHTHSQCRPSFTGSQSSPNVNRSSFPQASVRSHSYYPPPQQRHAGDILTFDSPPHIHSTDDVFGVRRQSLSSRPPVQGDTPPYTDYSSQNTRPPALRILTYPDGAYDDEEDRSPLNNPNMMMVNSSATFEEPSSYQSHNPTLRRHHRPIETPGPTASVVEINPATNKFNSKRGHSTSSQTQPTNYVHLSRKCNPSMPISKSWGWRRKTVQPSIQIPPPRLSSSSSTITGTFIINPELYIPSSLLNAMEDPLFRFKPSSNTGGSRKTNLRLEIENGGIDVDIRLVPTTNIPSSSTNSGSGQLDCDTPVQTQVSASTSTTAFSHSGGGTTADSAFEKRPLPLPRLSQESPTTTRASPGVGKTLSRRDKKKPSQPTTIDLRIKQTHQDSIKINGPIVFPLIARIVSFFFYTFSS
jgi:hypothetical protein